MRFDPDRSFEPEIARQALPQAAEAVARIAEGYASSRGWMPRKGARGQQIQVKGQGEDVYVTNLRHGGHLVEWGSRNNAARAPLRRAVRSAGYRLQED